MTDRELIEKAAKAAGIEGKHKTEHLCVDGDWMDVTAIFLADEMGWWNPLEDDGDALRLVVALGIHLQFAMDFAVAYAGSVHAKQFTERNGSDPGAATRRAIVRAAAAMWANDGR